MIQRYLLDTNVLSELLRHPPNVGVTEGMRREAQHLATAAVAWHELMFGCHRMRQSDKREVYVRYLEEVVGPTLVVLPYDRLAAEWHAEERARLSAAGRTPPFADGQIAAVAQVNDLTLVTNNVRDFEGFRDLRVERWHR